MVIRVQTPAQTNGKDHPSYEKNTRQLSELYTINNGMGDLPYTRQALVL